MKLQLLVVLLCLALLMETSDADNSKERRRRARKKKYKGKPNIVIFLVDDLGYGDLEYPTSNTPHLSKLAREGLVLTQFYTTSPVSSPARASLLTGRYHMRTGVYPGGFAPNDIGGLPHNETTIAEGLKKQGYSTAIVGKWHLGVGKHGQYLPHRHGFDYYLGVPYAHDDCPCHTCFYPDQLCEEPCNPQYVPCPLVEIKNGRKKILQQPVDLTNLTVAMAEAAVNFIEKKSSQKKPFFLFYSFHHVHFPHFSGEQFRNASKRGTFGDSLREVDWSVGQVMKTVRLSGLNDHTFVFFTSDNGPDLSLKKRDREGSSGILRCGKGSTWEGGMRVPAIAWWRRMVIKGFSHQLSSIIDVLPTIFKIAGIKASENITLDGYDMTNFLYDRAGRVCISINNLFSSSFRLPLHSLSFSKPGYVSLNGEQRFSKRKHFFYFPELTNRTVGPYAMQWRGFKAHYITGGGDSNDEYNDPVCRRNTSLADHHPPLLFNINNDPQELTTLNPYDYSDILLKMEMMKNDYLFAMEWGYPETLRGQDDTLQLCANPHCTPFPYCCRTDLVGGEYEMDQL